MRKLTRKQLETDLDCQATQFSRTHRALNDVLNGEVEWFGLRPYRIGICRPCGPEGGIVIVRYWQPDPSDTSNGYAVVYGWEDWYPEMRDNDSQDKEIQYLRSLALKAHEYVLRVQREHFEKGTVVA